MNLATLRSNLQAPRRRLPARNAVGPTVQRLRYRQRLTQEDLAGRAAAVGWAISRDTVKRIERRDREVTDLELRLLAAALRVPLTELLPLAVT